MLDDPPNLTPQFSPDRLTQVLDLLRKVLPIERLVRSAPSSRAQRLGLLLGPGHEIFVIERLYVRHLRLLAGSLPQMAQPALKGKPRLPRSEERRVGRAR